MNVDFRSHFPPVNFPALVQDVAHMYNPQLGDGLRGSERISMAGY
jgi:hypothetical protein